ncbi:IS256 family transposase, partial [Saccharolobus shibatae]|nr:IS256 family transposase [Saccharolobus shibatae]
MELITIDEKALYGTPLNEAVKELGQNLTLVPNILPENALLNKSVKEIEKMA